MHHHYVFAVGPGRSSDYHSRVDNIFFTRLRFIFVYSPAIERKFDSNRKSDLNH